jgi:hypothetical protein
MLAASLRWLWIVRTLPTRPRAEGYARETEESGRSGVHESPVAVGACVGLRSWCGPRRGARVSLPGRSSSAVKNGGRPSTRKAPPTRHGRGLLRFAEANRVGSTAVEPDLTEVRPDAAAPPREVERPVTRRSDSYDSFLSSDPQLPFGSVRQLPVGPGEVLCLGPNCAQENSRRILSSFLTHRFVHTSPRVCPQGVPRVVHKRCA